MTKCSKKAGSLWPSAKQVVCGSNLASYLSWNIHVGKVTGCFAGYTHQQRCHTRGESQERISHTPPQSSNKTEPTLALKPRGDITRSPKQGYQRPQKWTCVQQRILKKTKSSKNQIWECVTQCNKKIFCKNFLLYLITFLRWIDLQIKQQPLQETCEWCRISIPVLGSKMLRFDEVLLL